MFSMPAGTRANARSLERQLSSRFGGYKITWSQGAGDRNYAPAAARQYWIWNPRPTELRALADAETGAPIRKVSGS